MGFINQLITGAHYPVAEMTIQAANMRTLPCDIGVLAEHHVDFCYILQGVSENGMSLNHPKSTHWLIIIISC